jgi:hypothetical protein
LVSRALVVADGTSSTVERITVVFLAAVLVLGQVVAVTLEQTTATWVVTIRVAVRVCQLSQVAVVTLPSMMAAAAGAVSAAVVSSLSLTGHNQ